MSLFTIGYSNRPISTFIEILKANRIRLVADVRRYPSSPKFPHYNGPNLQKTLRDSDIIYQWMGDSLGGFRLDGYDTYMETDEYNDAIEQLIEMGSKLNTAIMCAEKSVTQCHRLYISESLAEAELQVTHIIDKENRIEHRSLIRERGGSNIGNASQLELPF